MTGMESETLFAILEVLNDIKLMLLSIDRRVKQIALKEGAE